MRLTTTQDVFVKVFRQLTNSMQYPVSMEVLQSKESLQHVSFDVR